MPSVDQHDIAGYRLGAERTQAVPTRSGKARSSERLPVGQLHAMHAETGVAACGQVAELHDFGDWRRGLLRYCPDCVRLVPFT